MECIPIWFDYIIKNLVNTLLVSWPFIIFIVFLFTRKAFGGLLKKIMDELHIHENKVSMGRSGQQVVPTDENPINPAFGNKDKKNKSKKYDVPSIEIDGMKKYVFALEEKLKKDLKASPYKEIDILIRDDALFRMSTEFERIYRIIFGSQIRLLRNISQKECLKYSEIKKFFKKEMLKFKESELTFDSWINFIVNHALLKKEKSIYKISDKGSAFLSYLALHNYEDRLL